MCKYVTILFSSWINSNINFLFVSRPRHSARYQVIHNFCRIPFCFFFFLFFFKKKENNFFFKLKRCPSWHSNAEQSTVPPTNLNSSFDIKFPALAFDKKVPPCQAKMINKSTQPIFFSFSFIKKITEKPILHRL